MLKRDSYNKFGFWPKSFKGLLLGLSMYLSLSSMLFILGSCAENHDNEVVEEAAVKEQEEIIEVLAKAGWNYELLANNYRVAEFGVIYVDDSELNIILRETLPPYYDEHIELFEQGRLKNAAEHVSLLTEEKLVEKTATEGTTVSDVPVAYLFEDLEPGDVIELEVSRELQERLHLEAEVVTIEKR